MQRALFRDYSLIVILAASVLALPGCRREPQSFQLTDTVKMVIPVGALNDVNNVPERVAKLFAPGSVPPEAELARFEKYEFTAGKPSASGDEAHIPVTLKDASTGTVVKEVEWTVVKVGEEWKLKSAPLQ